MKKTVIVLISLLSVTTLSAQFENLEFGTDSTLDIVSWNIEWFPKEGQITIDYVSEILQSLDAEVFAIQEIDDEASFEQLLDGMPGWLGFHLNSSYLEMAYIYKEGVMDNVEIYEILTNKSRELPRPPLVLEMDYEGQHYVIINNHLKCCGDGLLDMNDDWDEEKRRYDACYLIDEYILEFYPNDKVVLLGDLNDILTDIPTQNVFEVFLADADQYWFTDMGIAQGGSSGWSYPSWPSHLDHIMISSEIYDEFADEDSEILTIKLEEHFEGGWSEYDEYVSDHRPMGLKIKNISSLGTQDLISENTRLANYPNPFSNNTTLSFDKVESTGKLIIYNVKQQEIAQFELTKDMSRIDWNTDNLAEGVYIAKLIITNKVVAVQKMIMTK